MSDAAGTAMEIRLHGRGGQGGVTCAKIIAAVYARLGKSVQTFGDYAGERSGAPVRAYTRVADETIANRNKVYRPDHLLVLDETLLGDDTVAGLAPGGTLVINSPDPPEKFAQRYGRFRIATVDATAMARRHKIGTRSLVIVNTTIAGAFVRAMDLPLDALTETYRRLGFFSNFEAAREAFDAVRVREADPTERGARNAPTAEATAGGAEPGAPRRSRGGGGSATGPAEVDAGKPRPDPLAELPPLVPVETIVDHHESPPMLLKTGNWRSQTPRYAKHLAPCSAFCPAGNDVVGFVQALAREGEKAAAAVLGRTTALSAVCGRVCPAPCMAGCNRAEYDGAVNIRALERWIADHHPVAESAIETTPDPRRIAIVGSGPAGLSAAYTLARKGHKVTVYEGERELGGVLRTGIPTYRLPRDVLDREIDAILRLGVEAKTGEFLDPSRIEQISRRYDAVVLAAGLQKLRGVDGGAAGMASPAGVEQGIRFLHRVNLDGQSKLAGTIVVLGGGNTAMDCARSALRLGATKVIVAYRRTRAEMPAIAEEIDEAIHEGVEMLYLRTPVGFRGGDRVEAVQLAEIELGQPDESGRRRPVVTDRRVELPCDGVLLALGQSSDLSLLPAGWELKDGRLHALGRPTHVFAAGDFATGDGTVAHAIGDGRRAADRALAALGYDVEVFARPDRAAAVPLTDIRIDHFARAHPAREFAMPLGARAHQFDEVNRGLASALESHRCFSCGDCTFCDTCLVYCPEGIIHRTATGYEIDYTYCKGCGICVTECPRSAMEMTS
jgi:2-oxoacid:acceptor oxidoreductase gamma subunit (pyruvate/2-ketoisovalerate family)